MLMLAIQPQISNRVLDSIGLNVSFFLYKDSKKDAYAVSGMYLFYILLIIGNAWTLLPS